MGDAAGRPPRALDGRIRQILCLGEFGRRREIDVQGTPVAVVAPEDLILSKLDWARQSGSELQRRDVQNIIAAVGDLDWDYLEQWAGQLQLGEMLEQVSRNEGRVVGRDDTDE